MFKLGVNIDHVATLRQARGGTHPRPVDAARVCEKAGAHSIVMHLREDRRHVRDSDLFEVKLAVGIRLNMEMSVAPGIVRVALKLRPDQVTLVPEKRRERTTEGGLDVIAKRRTLERLIPEFRRRGIITSLFIDPDRRQVDASAALGVEAVEFHTGDYANASGRARRRELERLRAAVGRARRLGLVAHAGHGLDYGNVKALRSIKGLDELNIGYSIVTRAVWTGLSAAVRDMKKLLR
jgi:pyridoxine 5-phosphate synthase